MIYEWWLHSTNILSGQRSKVGPFKTGFEAVDYANMYRNPLEWYRVYVTLRRKKS